MFDIYSLYVLLKEYNDGYFTRNEIVYVGQSKNVKKRIYQHKNKDFDIYKIIDSRDTLKEIKELENEYIKKYDPIYNKSLNLIGRYNTLEGFINEFEKNNFNLSKEDIIGMMHIALRCELKPIFSNKYSEFTFYKIYSTYFNEKQFGGF